MKTLPLRPTGAKNSASVCPKPASPLLIVTPPAPGFEPPDPSWFPPDDPSALLDPSETATASSIPPLYRNASRRALYAHRFRLVACQYEAILFVALNHNCLEIGHASLAQGGVARPHIALPTLLAKAHALEAKSIILMQNRPGRVAIEPPIDPLLTLQIAVFCDLAGIPLVEHIYINRKGEPFFVRERGILNNVPDLVSTLGEGTQDVATKEVGRGNCAPNHYEEKKAARAMAEALAPIEVTIRRPGRPDRDPEST